MNILVLILTAILGWLGGSRYSYVRERRQRLAASIVACRDVVDQVSLISLDLNIEPWESSVARINELNEPLKRARQDLEMLSVEVGGRRAAALTLLSDELVRCAWALTAYAAIQRDARQADARREERYRVLDSQTTEIYQAIILALHQLKPWWERRKPIRETWPNPLAGPSPWE